MHGKVFDHRGIRQGIWLLLFLMGMFIGVCIVHFQKQSSYSGVFGECFMNQYAFMEIDHEKMLRYIGSYRIRQYVMLVCCGALPMAAYLLAVLVTGMGAVWGSVISISAIRLGMKGIVICVIGLLPQFLFYIPAFGWIVLWIWKQGKSRKKYIALSMAGLLFLLFGILTEVYVNPLILQYFLRKI